MRSVLLVLVWICFVESSFAQSAAINTDGSNADASAILDVKSTNKGMLVPRMTTAQRTGIASPAKGLLVFDNDTGDFWFYNGTAWTSLSTGEPINYWTQNGGNIVNNNSGRVGIGVTTPLARFSVDSSLMIDQADVANGSINSSALIFGKDRKVGIANRRAPGSGATSGLAFYTNATPRVVIDSIGRVGIGTSFPQYPLEIVGNTFVSGVLGIGVLDPQYRLHTTIGYFSTRIGVGTVPTPTYALDVDGGPSRFRTDTRIDGVLNPNNTLNIGNNTNIEGNLTVNAGKGIIQNTAGATQLKYYTRTAAFSTGNLGGFNLSAEGSVGFPGGMFSSPPVVYAANIVSTGGTTGELYRVQLVIYDVTTTGCKVRLLNTSPSTVNYSITWNIVCIGN